MKGVKQKNKKKFIDINTYQNNNISNKESDNINKIKKFNEYETPLQTLIKLFPNFTEDVIESIYEDNDRIYARTKKLLEQMCIEDSDQNLFNDDKNNTNALNEKIITNELNFKNNANLDINSLVKFKYEGEDPFLDDDLDLKKMNSDNLIHKKNMKKKFIDIGIIKTQQKKNSIDYVSILENINNDCLTFNNEFNITDNYLEELTLDYYCDILFEFFPKLSRIEIMQKICDYDFDIDKLVLHFFDEKNDNIVSEEFKKLEAYELPFDMKEEILSNFYNRTSNLNELEDAIFNHNLQNKIEKEIKKINLTSKFYNIYNENDFPFISEEHRSNIISQNNFSDEYFLDKDIKDIKNKNIREDLTKLCKQFPFTNELDIKWVYYQYMSFNETFKYFKNDLGKKIGETKLNFEDNEINSIRKNSENKIVNEKLNNEVNYESKNNQDSESLMLYKIVSENPSLWKMEKNLKNINIGEYQTIRKKLIWQAQLAWRSGRNQDAKVIMAKARRYKQEINTLLKNKKIELFLKNNRNNSILNLIDNKENFIDLHGLSYDESKMIINKKISDIKKRQQDGDIDISKKFILNIITGVGNHSKDNKPILLPKISNMLKNMNYSINIDKDRGTIRIFL